MPPVANAEADTADKKEAVIKETDKPLGQHKHPRHRPARWRPSLSHAALAVAAIALIGASTAIALHPSPFRDPPQTVVSTPSVAAAKAVSKPQAPAVTTAPQAGTDLARAAVRQASTGPKIIHVAPSAHGDGITLHDPASLGTRIFSSLPDRALIEESEMGPLPVRGPDGRRPFDVYARPSSATSGPRIAIVIGGLGLSQTGTQEAIEKLPGVVTLAFAPQGNSLDRWMAAARVAGHEIMVQVPLEPYDYPNVNPGRNTLTVSASPNQTMRELRWALSRITNYTGIMNYMGARYSADQEAMELLMEEVGERGLLYLDDGTSSRSVAERIAGKEGVPFARGDGIIDAARDRGAILKQLNGLEEIARQKGSAIGTGSAFELTVETVADWAAGVGGRGIELVPVSALAHDPEANQMANDR